MKGDMNPGNKAKNSMVGGGMKKHLPSSNGKPTMSTDAGHSFGGKASSHLGRTDGMTGNKYNPGKAPR